MNLSLLISCTGPQSSQGFSTKCRSENTVNLKVPSLRKVRRGLFAYGFRVMPSAARASSTRCQYCFDSLADSTTCECAKTKKKPRPIFARKITHPGIEGSNDIDTLWATIQIYHICGNKIGGIGSRQKLWTNERT